MRYLADENVSRIIVETLRAEGIDVAVVGASDVDVLAAARDDGRALITGDHDFGEMVIRQNQTFARSSCSNWIACRAPWPLEWSRGFCSGTATALPGI